MAGLDPPVAQRRLHPPVAVALGRCVDQPAVDADELAQPGAGAAGALAERDWRDAADERGVEASPVSTAAAIVRRLKLDAAPQDGDEIARCGLRGAGWLARPGRGPG